MESVFQFKVLFKKNLLIKSKSKCAICCEIVFPIVIIALLLAILGIIQTIKPDFDMREIKTLNQELIEKSIILYGPTPLTTEQQGIMNVLVNNIASANGSTPTDTTQHFLPFPDLLSMDTFFANNSDFVLAGLWFNSTAPATPTTPFAYSLRVDANNVPATDKVFDKDSDALDYSKSGWLSVQAGIDQAILEFFGANETMIVQTQRFADPYTATWQKWNVGRDAIFKNGGSIFITAALFMFSFRLITELVSEKETKIREGMRMMGMNDTSYILSWIATTLVIALPITFLLALLFRASQIIYHTGWGSVIILFILYLFTLILLGFIASIFFDNSRFAGIVSFGIVLGINIAGIFVANANISKYAKFLLSLISPIGMACANYSMAVKDLTDVNVLPSNSYLTDVDEIIGMMICDIVLYALIYWYLDNVVKSEYGTAKPLLFFLQKSYWITPPKNTSEMDVESITDNGDVELVSTGNKTTVSIRNLRKEFETGNGIRVAVDGLNLDMYKNQIHAFLGHNGAGKSTTIGMLTGLIPANGGDAIVNGYSIQSQMKHVRRTLGVVPQHDIIWSQLTVREHLVIYAGLKGLRGKEIENEAIKMANEVGLKEKINAPAGSLSGGQKRKLCLGIAFIGRSEVIFLDEVTSGMDPLSRRGVWDFLLKYKKGRTIVLTTHFMDEADFLGDRIAIISHGKLRCDGSSLYLKKKFGVGYLLTLSKIGGCDTNGVTRFIQTYIPECVVLSDAGTELSFRLPSSSVGQFVPLFTELDQQKGYLGIGHYGISVTTMEEVFLRIGQESSTNGRQFNINSNDNHNEEAVRRALSTNSEGTNWRQQLKGLFIKRLQTTRQDLKAFLLSAVLPILLIAGSIGMYKGVSQMNFFNDVQTPMTFSLADYGLNNTIPFQTINGDVSSMLSSPFYSEIIPLSGLNIDQYLEKNYKHSAGAFNFSEPIQVSATGTPLNYTLYYNKGYLHSSPIHMNMLNDAILRNHTGGTGIVTGNMPFRHVRDSFEAAFESVNISATIYFSLIFLAGYCLMSASFGAQMCAERANNIKRLLYISGCKKYIYWITNLLWDHSIGLFMVCVISGVLAGVESQFKSEFGIIFIAQVLYTLSATPFAYFFSYRFDTSGRALGGIFGIHIGVAFVMMVVGIQLRAQTMTNLSQGLQDAANIVDIIFYIFSPAYCLGRVMILVLKFPGTLPLGQLMTDNYWQIKLTGTPLLFLAAHTVVWTTVIILIDYMPEMAGKLRRRSNKAAPPPPFDEDSDVAQERDRVERMNSSDELLLLRELHKSFPAVGKNPVKIAVHNTTLGIPRGQTFGLLGMNGAGKTTTLSMLSGDIFPTSGIASINGHDLVNQRANALSSIGSCPQFDALIPLLNAREQLYLYCRIKGIPEHLISETVEAFISMMDLVGIAKSRVGGYSGGNKRKMSLSIAMLGNPSVVFLDEPSTGCDPQVRRFMWNIISELGKNKVIIITTHSMEECEALCQRISIMKDGKFTCLGSNQHIKSKFGSGYSIDIKFKKEYMDNDTGINTVLSSFPGSFLLDKHDLIANFELPNPSHSPIQVSAIFNTLQTQLISYVDDYSVSQTSLEQVFLKLTSSTYEQRLETLSESQGPSLHQSFRS